MKRNIITALLSCAILISTACINNSTADRDIKEAPKTTVPANAEKATFAMGCFWHSEEMFSELKGVFEAVPGYSGGTVKNPSYEEVGTGTTGHAESVDISFDPKVISYEQLLQVFFTEHDPTTPNYAAPDEGPQYRSIAFYRNDAQKQAIEKYIQTLTESKKYPKPIITQVTPFTAFYKAEDYHLHYFKKHPDQGYIANVTKPEIEKFRKDFSSLLKEGY
jgi:peptide-methionine (S)-S-oxide reductase